MKKTKIMITLLIAVMAYIPVGLAWAQETEEKMQYITKNGTQASSVGSETYFTGHVRVDPMFGDKGADAPFTAAYVTFAPGARSFWHTHPNGQHLVVTHGTGWTSTWNGEKTTIQAGDVVWCPPGVKHWHGASATSGMTHLALTGVADDGKNVEWLEAVSDEQYHK